MNNSYIDLLLNSDFSRIAIAMLIVWLFRTLVFPALVSMLLVRMTITLSHHYDVMARPSDRGSHSVPTPRLGGLGAALGVYITVVVMSKWGVNSPLEPWRLVLLIGGAWALIGGALDDFQELPPRWKLLVQIAAAGSVIMFGFAPDILDLPFYNGIHLHPVTGALVALLVSFFMMNIFNFMDGMDGQAAVFGIVTGLGLAAFLGNHGFSRGFGITWTGMYLAGMATVTAGSLIGLLIHNYPGRNLRTKTFMGDCGSQFYGFVLAVIALQAGDGPPGDRFPWIASLILFSPFIYDVCYTLIRRYRRGDRLTQAHRTHLYQRLMVAGWSHGRTLLFNSALYIIMLVLALIYADSHQSGLVQIIMIILAGITLAGYTWLVERIEKINARPTPVL